MVCIYWGWGGNISIIYVTYWSLSKCASAIVLPLVDSAHISVTNLISGIDPQPILVPPAIPVQQMNLYNDSRLVRTDTQTIGMPDDDTDILFSEYNAPNTGRLLGEISKSTTNLNSPLDLGILIIVIINPCKHCSRIMGGVLTGLRPEPIILQIKMMFNVWTVWTAHVVYCQHMTCKL